MAVSAHAPNEASSTDRIERQYVFKATRSRIWRALSDSQQFSNWFGMTIKDAFAEGRTVKGNLTYKGYEHVVVDITVERISPERYFSYRWHPGAVDAAVDYSAEPTTLVEFTLTEAEGGTAVTIVESGFDRIPAGRRVEAFRMNEKGWDGQIKNLAKYVE